MCGGVKRSDAWTCVFSRWEAPQGKRQAGPGVSSQFQPEKLRREISYISHYDLDVEQVKVKIGIILLRAKRFLIREFFLI